MLARAVDFLPANMSGGMISVPFQYAVLGLNQLAPGLIANDSNTGVLKSFLMDLRIFRNLKGLQFCASERFARY